MTELRNVTKIALRRFLATEYGTEVLLYMRECVPSISRGQPHEVQFDAGLSQGFIKAIDLLQEVSTTPVKEERPDQD